METERTLDTSKICPICHGKDRITPLILLQVRKGRAQLICPLESPSHWSVWTYASVLDKQEHPQGDAKCVDVRMGNDELKRLMFYRWLYMSDMLSEGV